MSPTGGGVNAIQRWDPSASQWVESFKVDNASSQYMATSAVLVDDDVLSYCTYKATSTKATTTTILTTTTAILTTSTATTPTTTNKPSTTTSLTTTSSATSTASSSSSSPSTTMQSCRCGVKQTTRIIGGIEVDPVRIFTFYIFVHNYKI